MLKAYIAGPFFNNKERTYLNEMISWVKEHYKNVELYIPMEHEIINGVKLPNKIWAKRVYDEDVQAINDADLVFVLYLGHYSDSGTAWEVGYASAKNKPIFLYIPEEYQGDTSMMVINSGVIITNNTNLNQK